MSRGSKGFNGFVGIFWVERFGMGERRLFWARGADGLMNVLPLSFKERRNGLRL